VATSRRCGAGLTGEAMTRKAKNPMAPLDCIELAIAKAAHKLFPDDPRLDAEERARLVQDAAEFSDAVTAIIDLVDEAARDAVIDRALKAAKKYTNVDDSHRTELRMLRREQIINQVVVACLACATNVDARHQNIERLRQDIKRQRALLARRGKSAPSKSVGEIVSHHAIRLWKQKPWLRRTAHGTADEIVGQVNADLQEGDLKKLGAKEGVLSVSAIAKRVGRIPR
jgi:hypothetical protein